MGNNIDAMNRLRLSSTLSSSEHHTTSDYIFIIIMILLFLFLLCLGCQHFRCWDRLCFSDTPFLTDNIELSLNDDSQHEEEEVKNSAV